MGWGGPNSSYMPLNIRMTPVGIPLTKFAKSLDLSWKVIAQKPVKVPFFHGPTASMTILFLYICLEMHGFMIFMAVLLVKIVSTPLPSNWPLTIFPYYGK